MNQDEKRKLETRLVAMGLNGVKDGDMGMAFAKIVEDFPFDKHWFFRGLLNECEAHRRREMYEAIVPHFTRFQPKSLETYLMEITEEASRMVSHRVMRVEGRRPDAIEVNGERFIEAGGTEGSHTVVVMRCIKCQRRKLFVDETNVDAIMKARQAGWVYVPVQDVNICPKCPTSLRPRKKVHYA